MSVKDTDLGLKRFIAEMQSAKSVEVVIGILEGTMNDGQSVAEYAAYNEFGTDRIPERSFMRTSFDENVGNINRDMQHVIGQVQQGQMTVVSALRNVGLKHVDRVQKKIGSNIQPANSPYTIAKKGSSRTLFDEGIMINSVRHLVRKPR
jgi:hypothetical protein